MLAKTISLGCIADDYTGASDLANTLTRQGLRTVQTIGVPSIDLALPEVDAVVVSLKSRSIEAGLAVSRSREAEKWLRGRGARFLPAADGFPHACLQLLHRQGRLLGLRVENEGGACVKNGSKFVGTHRPHMFQRLPDVIPHLAQA